MRKWSGKYSRDVQFVRGKSTLVQKFVVNFLQSLYVVGGQAPKAIRSVECYDFKDDGWRQVAEMTTRRCRAGVAVFQVSLSWSAASYIGLRNWVQCSTRSSFIMHLITH